MPSIATGGYSVSEARGSEMPQNPCYARRFALLRNSSLTVPMYADRLELLVFGASLTSDSLSKMTFDRLCRTGLSKTGPAVHISGKLYKFID